MLTTSDSISLEDTVSFSSGQGRQAKAPDVYCIVRLMDMVEGRHQVEVVARDNDGNYIAGALFEYTTTQVNGKTGTGADDAAKYFNCIEQLVLFDLETFNPSATITIV